MKTHRTRARVRCAISTIRSVSVRRILSAPRCDGGSHLSRDTVARVLQRPTRCRPAEAGGSGQLPNRHHAWPCSAWGLHCRPGYPVRGELLPRHFTLTPGRARGGILSVALSVVSRRAEARRLDAQPLAGTLPCGVRTFLPDTGSERLPDTLRMLSMSVVSTRRPRRPSPRRRGCGRSARR
jgi:hypothetical protein